MTALTSSKHFWRAVTLQNVNLTNPSISAGIRVRIKECDLPQALRIIENIEILAPEAVRTLHDETHPSILVPVDFSDSSLKAALVAFRIAASLKVDIHLLHTYVDPAFSGRSVMQLSDSLTFDAPPVDTVDEVRLDRDLDKVAGEQMSEFEGKIRDKIRAGVIPGVRFTSEVTEGLPEETIYDYCTANKNPLTVMGTRGADSHSRQLVGSVAAEVLDRTREYSVGRIRHAWCSCILHDCKSGGHHRARHSLPYISRHSAMCHTRLRPAEPPVQSRPRVARQVARLLPCQLSGIHIQDFASLVHQSR